MLVVVTMKDAWFMIKKKKVKTLALEATQSLNKLFKLKGKFQKRKLGQMFLSEYVLLGK